MHPYHDLIWNTMYLNNFTENYKVLPQLTVASCRSPAACWLSRDTRTRWSSSRCTSWWTRSSPPRTRPPPGGEWSPAVNISLSGRFPQFTFTKSMTSSWSPVQHLANSVSQTFLPYLNSRHRNEVQTWPDLTWPVVEHLQPLHHLVSLTTVVVGGQVVYPAAQRLAGLATTWRRKYLGFLVFTWKKGSNQLVLPEAGAGLTRVWGKQQ